VHILPAYQSGSLEEAEREGIKGGKILCPSAIGKASPTNQQYSPFLSAIDSLELIEVMFKNEDNSKRNTRIKANNFRNPHLIFLLWLYLFNPLLSRREIINANSSQNLIFSGIFGVNSCKFLASPYFLNY